MYSCLKTALGGISGVLFVLGLSLVYGESSVFLEWGFCYGVCAELVMGVYLD